jgi:predicted nuclease of predicted toxin-antitoxin system
MSPLRESATRSSRDRRMRRWIDAPLSPALARGIRDPCHIEAQAVRELGLCHATDPVIFKAAREAGVVVMSKDEDFRFLVERLGPPPQVLRVTCGNTSNARLRTILTTHLPTAIALLQQQPGCAPRTIISEALMPLTILEDTDDCSSRRSL